MERKESSSSNKNETPPSEMKTTHSYRRPTEEPTTASMTTRRCGWIGDDCTIICESHIRHRSDHHLSWLKKESEDDENDAAAKKNDE